jgi:hypothetical protein
LPSTFRFSQSSLQDFVDCSRRFQLRYVESQPWPGVQAEPFLEYERHLERGAEFHRLVERHQLGMSAEVVASGIGDDVDLLAWWRAYLDFDFLHKLGGVRYPEFTLSTRLVGVALSATFDLLVVIPGERIIIFDWKTARSVSRQWLEVRLQTRVYPLVLSLSGGPLFSGELRPEQILMVYWFSGALRDWVSFEYDGARFDLDREYLEGLLRGVLALGDVVWPLTVDERYCRFCGYRSLCGRGSLAGGFNDSNDTGNIALELGLFGGLLDVDEGAF